MSNKKSKTHTDSASSVFAVVEKVIKSLWLKISLPKKISPLKPHALPPSFRKRCRKAENTQKLNPISLKEKNVAVVAQNRHFVTS